MFQRGEQILRRITWVHKQFLWAGPFLDCSFILRAGRWDGAIRQEAVPDKGSDKKVKLCQLRGSDRNRGDAGEMK